jgi:hypothetical protein
MLAAKLTSIAPLAGDKICAGGGGSIEAGDHVKIKPFAGYTVLLNTQLALLAKPKVVVLQFVVVVLLKNSALDAPLKPT